MTETPRPLVRGRSACLTAAEAAAAGPELLAELWWQGVRRVVVPALPDEAPAQPGVAEQALVRAIARFNRLLDSRGLSEAMRLGRVSPAERDAWSAIRADERGANPRRRSLLRALSVAEPAADGGAGGPPPPSPPPSPPAAPPAAPLVRLQRLGEDRPEALFAAVPRIDPARCDGCDACTTVCPAEALILVIGPTGELGYTSDPAVCTGCSLCVDICDRGAVELGAFGPRPEPVPLVRFTCAGCGAPVHEPSATAARTDPAGLCRICRKTRHHARLFQVLG